MKPDGEFGHSDAHLGFIMVFFSPTSFLRPIAGSLHFHFSSPCGWELVLVSVLMFHRSVPREIFSCLFLFRRNVSVLNIGRCSMLRVSLLKRFFGPSCLTKHKSPKAKSRISVWSWLRLILVPYKAKVSGGVFL